MAKISVGDPGENFDTFTSEGCNQMWPTPTIGSREFPAKYWPNISSTNLMWPSCTQVNIPFSVCFIYLDDIDWITQIFANKDLKFDTNYDLNIKQIINISSDYSNNRNMEIDLDNSIFINNKLLKEINSTNNLLDSINIETDLYKDNSEDINFICSINENSNLYNTIDIDINNLFSIEFNVDLCGE